MAGRRGALCELRRCRTERLAECRLQSAVLVQEADARREVPQGAYPWRHDRSSQAQSKQGRAAGGDLAEREHDEVGRREVERHLVVWRISLVKPAVALAHLAVQPSAFFLVVAFARDEEKRIGAATVAGRRHVIPRRHQVDEAFVRADLAEEQEDPGALGHLERPSPLGSVGFAVGARVSAVGDDGGPVCVSSDGCQLVDRVRTVDDLVRRVASQEAADHDIIGGLRLVREGVMDRPHEPDAQRSQPPQMETGVEQGETGEEPAPPIERELRPVEVQEPIATEPGNRHLDEERDRSEVRAPLHIDGGAVDTRVADRSVEHLLVRIRINGIDDQAQSVSRRGRREEQTPESDRTAPQCVEQGSHRSRHVTRRARGSDQQRLLLEQTLKRIKYAIPGKLGDLQLAVQGLLVFKNQRTYVSLLRTRGRVRRILETRDGIRPYARENIWDARIIREISVQRPYLRGFVDLPPAPVVVDVGGYIGDFSIYAARRMNASRVIVYEPTSENWRMLVDNIALNELQTRIVAVNEAVGESGTLKLNVDVDGQEIHSSAYWYPDAPKREVPSITLDQLLDAHELTHVDLLKVDCEGGEYDIFSIASDDALARIRRFTMEWHLVGDATERLRTVMIQRLRDAGFRMWQDGQILRGAR